MTMKVALYNKAWDDVPDPNDLLRVPFEETKEAYSKNDSVLVEFLEMVPEDAVSRLASGDYDVIIAHLSGFWSESERKKNDPPSTYLHKEYVKRRAVAVNRKNICPVWIHVSSQSQQDKHECCEGVVHLYLRASYEEKRYRSAQPWIEMINAFETNGTELGLHVVNGRIPRELRAFFGDTIYYEYLPALSILCQGWLSVYWTLNPLLEGEESDLQKAVGFEDIPPEYRSILAGRREKIEAPAWWECLPSEGFAEAILHELETEDWSEYGKIKVLLDRMQTGIPLDSEKIVRNAFVEISGVLKRSAE